MGVQSDMLGSLKKVQLAVIVLASSVQTSGAIEWGRTENGLRMAAAIVRNDFGNYELEATIENTTSKEILIVLGHVAFRFAEVVHVIVKPPNGSETAAFYLDSGGGVAPSRFMPMVLPLLPKSRYSIRTLLAGWGHNSPTLQRLEVLLPQKSSLRMELTNTIEERVRYGVRVDCYGSLPFWNGTLVSNTLHFPLTRDDPDDADERRFVSLDLSDLGNLLVVVYTYREPDTIRLISAWRANKRQRVLYEKGRC